MTFYVTNQNTVVLTLMALGAVFGVLRALLKVKRHFVRTGSILAFVEDFLYCAVCVFLFHITVFVTNYGYVRWYEFGGVILGFAMYRIMLEDITMKVLNGITALVIRVIRKALGIVFLPFRKILGRVFGLFRKNLLRLREYINDKRLCMYSLVSEKRMKRFSGNGFYISDDKRK